MSSAQKSINQIELLETFFLKVLTVKKSAKAMNNSFLQDVERSFETLVLADPLKQDLQTDKEKIDAFNILIGTNRVKKVAWPTIINTGVSINIDIDNKDETSKNILSNIYCQLSVVVFEALSSLLNELAESNSNNSEQIINCFYEKFREELDGIDMEKINSEIPTILMIHNLRLFRNCIVHCNRDVSSLETKFKNFNKSKKNSEILDSLGPLRKYLVGYEFSHDAKTIYLNNESFSKLLDTYTQLGYLAYLGYCRKNDLPDAYKKNSLNILEE